VSEQKFSKWNSYIDVTLDDVISLFDKKGIKLVSPEVAITGVEYNPQAQKFRISVMSLVTKKRDKELSKVWEPSIKLKEK